MNVWRLITHHEDKVGAFLWGQQHSRITIGWGTIGHIGKQGFSGPQEINRAIHKANPKDHSNHGGPSLWRFYAWMQKGDLVILKTDRGFESVVEVTGDYEWSDAPRILNGAPLSGEHYHQRRVARIHKDPVKLWQATGGIAAGDNSRQTLALCGPHRLSSKSS